MLRELSDVQESDEEIWGCPRVSFTITTRDDDEDQRIKREYTFSHAPEWDKWTFNEFEEKHKDDAMESWRRSRHYTWNDTEAPEVDVPQCVEEKLEELLEIDELTLRMP